VKELEEMRRLFTYTNPTEPRRITIWGVGGAGKTELAIRYAFLYKEEFSAVFYINAKDAASFGKSCLGIAEELKLPEAGGVTSGTVPEAVIEAVMAWFKDHDRGDWLLIVDNADNLDEFNPIRYLPAVNKGHTILTSRHRQSVWFGRAIELGGMEPEDAQELFLRKGQFKNATGNQCNLALEIATKLGFLPLPVEHAAAYVYSTGELLHNYLQNLERRLQPYPMSSPQFGLHEATVQETVNIAWDAIIRRNTKAAELLAILSYLDSEGVGQSQLLTPSTEVMFRNWKCHTNRADYDAAIQVLQSFSMVQFTRVDDVETIVRMHASVAHCIRTRFNKKITWTLLHRSLTFIWTISKDRPIDGTHFAHYRSMINMATELFNQPDHGESPPAIWWMIGPIIARYMHFWAITGLAYEMENASKATMQALADEKTPYDIVSIPDQISSNRLSRICAMLGRLLGTLYTGSSDSIHIVLRDYLIDQMTPLAADFMRRLHEMDGAESQGPDFRPQSLVDVFKYQKPPSYVDLLLEILQIGTNINIAQNERIGLVYLRLSQIPKSETWMTQARRLLGVVSTSGVPEGGEWNCLIL
jgi:hypothetical protein